MKIALLGYGKMGKAVEKEAIARGHEIIFHGDLSNAHQARMLSPKECDCFIEFTHPESAIANFRNMLSTRIPIVTGTTGWDSDFESWKSEVLAAGTAFMYSSNFSPGVNMLFKLNQRLAELMNAYPEFDCYIEEAHHRHKKDAPSGTALSLANQLLKGLDRKDRIASSELQNRPPAENELSVAYTRAGEIIGKHKVSYTSDIETISIEHEAFNRRGFALGAVIGAEWLVGKRGFFEFSEIF